MKITFNLVYDVDNLTCLEDGNPDGGYTKTEKWRIEKFFENKGVLDNIESSLRDGLSDIVYDYFTGIHKEIMQDRDRAKYDGLHYEGFKNVNDIMEDYELTKAEACEVINRVMRNTEVEYGIQDIIIDAIQDIATEVKGENNNG